MAKVTACYILRPSWLLSTCQLFLHQLCLSVSLWNLWTMLFAGFCFSIAWTSIKNQRNASLITRTPGAKFWDIEVSLLTLNQVSLEHFAFFLRFFTIVFSFYLLFWDLYLNIIVERLLSRITVVLIICFTVCTSCSICKLQRENTVSCYRRWGWNASSCCSDA